MRPFLIPLSPEKIKLKVLIYPVSKARLTSDYPHYDSAAFPGLELFSVELPLFPQSKQAGGKDWGCPIIPMILLGAEGEDQPNLPPTTEISRAVSAIMRTAKVPDVKRDNKNLFKAWKDIKESGPSRLKEKLPDLIWPEVTEKENQTGQTCLIYLSGGITEKLYLTIYISIIGKPSLVSFITTCTIISHKHAFTIGNT